MNAITTRYATQKVGALDIFYREAGPADGPVLLLLHGYPSSGHMFRDLIWRLADTYRVIAPDLPGFGSTKAPPRGTYDYNFANLAKAMEGFTEALGLTRYALYVFDYGAPTGMRLAGLHPERVSAIISQNGNAYEEGLLDAWGPVRTYWANPTPENREALRMLQTRDVTLWQYTAGVPDAVRDRVGPDGIAHDQAILDRPEGAEIQLDLIGDYKSNVALYPEWQAYLREHRPPVLAVWGKGDPFFGPEGAKAFARDVPEAEIHLLDTGHFALETHAAEIAAYMRAFLGRVLGPA
ncbi:alpha/beta fold hydrolase [Acuticoccus kandeliae]|uniref:alpha/beta fold hydrolase n=1 Tax=Acuticoccus kandeliae TaxID=2073160 RepID=UPI000D3E58EE|nr:alpha/beta hydrolase [Acuticoccus kandeliae]